MNYKKLIVESGKRMEGSGLTVETWGNISCRDPETQLIYLTPSAMHYNIITEDDVVVCRLDGTVVEGTRKPTIEKDMHLMIYRHRSDVNAIIHTHPVYSMVYAVQGKSIPLFIDEAAQMLGDVVKCTDYALPGSKALAENCVGALGEKGKACLVHSHGAVCAGADMEGAFMTAAVLELAARIFYMTEATGGKPAGISEENVQAMQAFIRDSYGQGK